MKKLLCFLMVLAILCVSVCGCNAEHTDEVATKEEFLVKYTPEQAWVLFKAQVISWVNNYYGAAPDYYTVSKFKYELVSWEDNGVEYEFYGNYTTYMFGKYANSFGYCGTVNKTTGFAYVKSIFNSTY